MIGIIFQNLTRFDGFEHVLEQNIFISHLDRSVLRNSDAADGRKFPDPGKYLSHRIVTLVLIRWLLHFIKTHCSAKRNLIGCHSVLRSAPVVVADGAHVGLRAYGRSGGAATESSKGKAGSPSDPDPLSGRTDGWTSFKCGCSRRWGLSSRYEFLDHTETPPWKTVHPTSFASSPPF